MHDSFFATIEHMLVHTGKKTLGVWTSPVGTSSTPLDEMAKKTEEWVYTMFTGKSFYCMLWVELD